MFNKNEFNFNKIDAREILLEITIQDVLVSFLINNSPLTKYHLLIVPDVKANLPQIMNEKCLQIALEIIRSTEDNYFRIGYNSPGALASVNHLHVHLLYIEKDLYLEDCVSSIRHLK